MYHFLSRILTVVRRARRKRSDTFGLSLLVTALLAFGTFGFWITERDTALAGLDTLSQLQASAWWAIVTMTTVGYGDLYPQTWQGRWLIGVPLMVVGIGVLGYAIGVLTNAVIERQEKEAKGMVRYKKDGHIVLCNCPSIDLMLEIAEEIRVDEAWKTRELVLVTDAFEEMPSPLRNAEYFFVSGNPCREHVLERANLAGAHRVMITSQNPQDENCDSVTLGVLVTVRAMAPDVYVVAECQREENRKLLQNAGASEIVGSGSLRAELMVQGMQDPGVNGLVEELLTNLHGHQFYVHELRNFRGTWKELSAEVAKRGDYALLGLIRDGLRTFLPGPEEAVAPGMKLMLVGRSRPNL